MSTEIDTILTVKEVAAELRLSTGTVYRLLDGKIPGIRPLPRLAIGRRKVIRRSSLDAWKAANETAMLASDQN